MDAEEILMGIGVRVGDLMAVADFGGGGKKFGADQDWGSARESSLLRAARWRRGLPPKRRGELAELAFVQKAMQMGYMVAKPWGDSDRYDFIVEAGRKLSRVQVRSTENRMGARGYAVHASVYVGTEIVGLTEKDIDVLVAYIVPRELWYVVPVRAFVPRKNLWFYPDGSKKGSKFEEWREAWWVLEE